MELDAEWSSRQETALRFAAEFKAIAPIAEAVLYAAR